MISAPKLPRQLLGVTERARRSHAEKSVAARILARLARCERYAGYHASRKQGPSRGRNASRRGGSAMWPREARPARWNELNRAQDFGCASETMASAFDDFESRIRRVLRQHVGSLADGWAPASSAHAIVRDYGDRYEIVLIALGGVDPDKLDIRVGGVERSRCTCRTTCPDYAKDRSRFPSRSSTMR